MENALSDLRSVTAVFDSADKAEGAIAWLLNVGIVASQIRQVAEAGPAPEPEAPAAPKKRRSFMDSFVDLVLPDDKAKAGKLKGGGPRLVTVTNIGPEMLDAVVRILSDQGRVRAEEEHATPSPEPTAIAPALRAPAPEAPPAPAEDLAQVMVDHRGPQASLPANPDMTDATGIRGLIGACLVDSQSGAMLASEGNGNLDVDRMARLNAEFMRTWDYSVDQLHMDEPLDEILMTLETQIHLVRPLERFRSVFLYVALDKASCNLGMARLQLRQLEANLAA